MVARSEDAPPEPAQPTPASPPSSPDIEQLVTRVYLAALRQEHPTRALLVAQGMPGQEVDRAIDLLVERRLLVRIEDGTWQPVSPDIALPAYATELERRARDMRASAHELAQVFSQTRSSGNPGDSGAAGVQSLHSMPDLHRATAEVVASARQSVLAVRNLSPRTVQVFEAPLSAHREPSYAADGRELSLRTAYVLDVLDLPNAREVLKARAEGGEVIRLVPHAPFSAVIADDTAAVVDLTAYDSSGAGSLLVRSRPLVLALSATLEDIWRLATPLRTTLTGNPFSHRDQLILSLLAAGSSDATAARQAGVSARTVERRMRSLMDRLGARTRFQAGANAARRGWLSDKSD